MRSGQNRQIRPLLRQKSPDRVRRSGAVERFHSAGHNRVMANPREEGGIAPGEAARTVAAVAGRLGVAPATLRTWDRRYGLGPSARLSGSHRRYGAEDLARLVVMRRLTLEGVAPNEAARIAREAMQEDLDDIGAALANVHQIGGPEGVEPDRAHAGPVTVTAVVDAALAMDAARCRRILAAGMADGAERWWS